MTISPFRHGVVPYGRKKCLGGVTGIGVDSLSELLCHDIYPWNPSHILCYLKSLRRSSDIHVRVPQLTPHMMHFNALLSVNVILALSRLGCSQTIVVDGQVISQSDHDSLQVSRANEDQNRFSTS